MFAEIVNLIFEVKMRLLFVSLLLLTLLVHRPIHSIDCPSQNEESRRLEGIRIYERSLEIAKFYDLPEEMDLKEITDVLLESPLISEQNKETIKQFDRRIFTFQYPSEGLQVKGILSLVQGDDSPVLVVLRGGNRIFGILNPASDLMCARDYTVIATTYRGGVSEGEDEFGGNDVNDVHNLVEFLPELERKLGLPFLNEKMYLLGASRGGMELFLALTRFPELQEKFLKVVSLSELLDLMVCISGRHDMKQMFQSDFSLTEENEEE
jgi:hypothetical protein